MRELVTQAEYARHRGVTKQAVSKAVKAGKIRLLDGLIDPREADQTWLRRDVQTSAPPIQVPAVRPAAPAPEGPRLTAADYWEAKTQRERAQAALAELELAEREGKLIDAGEASAVNFDIIRQLRDALLAAPERIAADFPGDIAARVSESSSREIRQAIEAAIARFSPESS